MPGAGTRTGITSGSAPPLLLDVTRLVSRAGRRPTGIDRVERAYLDRFLREEAPVFGLIRSALGYLLIDRRGMARLAAAFDGQSWGRPDLLSRLSWRGQPARQGLEAEMRRAAIARARPGKLRTMLGAHLAPGTRYYNVGHSNLSARVLTALGAIGAQRRVMIHDTIPLDLPQTQAPGATARFEAMLRRVGAAADLVIYPSEHSRRCAETRLRALGRVPPGCVARLGVTPLTPNRSELPPGFPPEGPYFVALGTIEPRKNHAFLLDLWEEMARRDPEDLPRLIFAGARGWAQPELFARLDSAPPSWLYECAGLSDDSIAFLLQNAAGLLFPSLGEGVGLPPVEALGLGCPVIAADLPAVREYAGNMVVYRNVKSPYAWERAIKALRKTLGGTEFSERVAPAGWSAPCWDAHFSITLSRVC
ncbi:glycosyltransferase family 4 protein [Poseidonocella sedimentorum]|uniref:Glycosyl transferases group 1 n=1 Tax=Poseidonocella sedimentorum TaxID=871652 RepID=A0A1I6D3Y8_9RHOB|nr:glycosyltransferase family 1 protein [Poseidonocella sedimentorum]SFR00204.1 Glycosyl transferases group 1 [Poseidonocella sedimentorum]